MAKRDVTKIGKLIFRSGEHIIKETFNKVSKKVESFQELSEAEQELMKFGINVYEYYQESDTIPDELEEQYLSLKRLIDKLEKK